MFWLFLKKGLEKSNLILRSIPSLERKTLPTSTPCQDLIAFEYPFSSDKRQYSILKCECIFCIKSTCQMRSYNWLNNIPLGYILIFENSHFCPFASTRHKLNNEVFDTSTFPVTNVLFLKLYHTASKCGNAIFHWFFSHYTQVGSILLGYW